MGCLAKLVFQFESVFWPRNQYVFGCIPEENASDYPAIILNHWPSHELNSLAIMAGGPLGRKIESFCDEEAEAWGFEGRLVGEMTTRSIPYACVAEMADRVQADDWSPNLDAVVGDPTR